MESGRGHPTLMMFDNPYIIAILVYLFGLIAVGVYKSRAIRNSADFMIAGRSLGWPVLVGTMLATWMGNGSLFGGAGLAYRNGLASLWHNAGAWLGIVLIYCIARRIRNFGQMTVPDIFETRYNRMAGVLATIITAIAYLTIVSYQFKGGGRVLNIITEGAIDVETGIIITAVFAISYTVLAGMISVVYTDVINGIVMIVGLLAGLLFMLNAVGGVGEVAAYAESADKAGLFGQWAKEGSEAGAAPVIAVSFLIPTMLLLLGDSNIYQRMFSARDSGSAKKAVLVLVFGVVLLESAIAVYGIVGATAADKGLIPDLA
ncbi:MAG: sodium:solute symporter family protein, partial [Verrucomicrobiota bacterium]